MYDKINGWAWNMGRKTIEGADDPKEGESLVRRLIFDIRGEETPGRFLNRLSSRLADYRTSRLEIDTSMHRMLFDRKWGADSFYYMKSAVISGLLNSLAYAATGEKEGEEGGGE